MSLDHTLAQLPIEELKLSNRAYNALRRAGIRSLGDLSAIIPQGPSSVQNVGCKTWQEIDCAFRHLVADHSIGTVVGPPAGPSNPDLAGRDKTSSLEEGARSRHEERQPDQPLEGAGLSSRATHILTAEGILTKEALLTLSVAQAAQVKGLTTLRRADWSRLTHWCKRLPCWSSQTHAESGEETPVEAVHLSRRALNCVRRAGIRGLAELLNCSLAELGSVRYLGVGSLREILVQVRVYLDARPQADSSREPVRPYGVHDPEQPDPSERDSGSAGTPEAVEDQLGRTPDIESGMSLEAGAPQEPRHEPARPAHEQVEVAAGSVAERMAKWLKPLPARSHKVIAWRYGLHDGEARTLEQVGQRLGMTRERARQIEAAAIKKLTHPTRRRIVQSLVECLRRKLCDAGGLATQSELAEGLAQQVDAGDISLQAVVRLLLDTHGGFYHVRRLDAWALDESCTALAVQIERRAAAILAAEHAPLSGPELLTRLKATELYRAHGAQVSDEFVLACLRISRTISPSGRKSYALQKWARSYIDDAILALRHLGRPAHYREIAQAINATLPKERAVTARTLHTRLGQHPELFVWVGRRGMYGLKEWGLERPQSYEDVLAHIISDAGHPMAFQEILAKLPELRPYYDESSVSLTLGTNSRFRAFSGDTYGLADWKEEDFAGDYRVRRVLQAGGQVARRRPKPEVVDSMRTVDEFVARARGGADDAEG